MSVMLVNKKQSSVNREDRALQWISLFVFIPQIADQVACLTLAFWFFQSFLVYN